MQPHFVGYRRYPVADQFIAQFFVKPPYHLGLKFEPRNLVGHEYTVRGYYEPRAADYILAGDKILKMDGVDVLDYEGLVHAWFRWKANSEVHIELMRAGKILKVKMPVFPNEI